MKITGLLLLLCILLVSCKNEVDSSEAVPEAGVASMNEIDIQHLIPVYDFEGLAPLLEKKNDTTYIINFWATWCKPCIRELPYFEEIGTNYGKQKVKVVLVSLDFPDRLENQVLPFIERHALKSEVVLLDDADANSWIPKVSAEWSGAIPATLIYNAKGRRFYEKSFTYNELETELKTIL